jgi:serine/threonine-protein kinase
MDDLLERLKNALADRYTVEREIGRGGMATVYLAEEFHPRRKVAIKVMTPDFGTRILRERFLREVNLTSKLAHPHIVPVFTAGEADGLLYYVMPYIDGESLRQRMSREGRLSLDDAVAIAREVAGALHYAHGVGAVHRDVKPENILLTQDHALVADFGIARALGGAGAENITQTGLAIGTPAYMSPEQGAGSPIIDARTDIYSLGCVLLEMLGGARQAGRTPEGRLNTIQETVRSVDASTSTLGGVASVLRAALAVEPADRFVSADAFARALAELQRPGPPVSAIRHAVGIGAVVGGVVVVAALIVNLLLPEGGGAATPDRVVVALFENQTGDPSLAHLGPMATDWITQGLARTGMLNVVRPTRHPGNQLTADCAR